MKESTLATKIMIGVLCAGVLLYLALYFVLGFKDEIATTTAYNYSVDVGTEASAIIVRSETVLTSTGGYVDLVLGEGEKTAAGGAVALIYDHPSALSTRQEIRSLEAELKQLRHALNSGTQTVDSAKLDQQVVGSIVSLRSLCASGDLTSLEDSILNLRTMVFQRDYTYGNTMAADQLTQLIKERETRLSALEKSLNQVSRTVTAPASGVFSGETDGFESLLTPDMLSTLTAEELAAFLDRNAAPQSDAVGKVITDSTWYLAALLEEEGDLRLTEGDKYLISFSHDYYGDVEMKLDRVEHSGGQILAVFSSREHLADTTLLRAQQVDVVVEQLTGIRIPRRALRVETVDGVNSYGVYTVVGAQAEWQEVEVLYTGDTYYLVAPKDESDGRRLRAGDTVILSSAGLYDGKVVW